MCQRRERRVPANAISVFCMMTRFVQSGIPDVSGCGAGWSVSVCCVVLNCLDDFVCGVCTIYLLALSNIS